MSVNLIGKIPKRLNHTSKRCREANTTVPAIPPSPAFTVASVTSVGSRLRSMAISHSESDASSSNGSPRHDQIRSRTEVGLYPSLESISTSSGLYESCGRPTRTSKSSIVSWDGFGRRSQNSWHDQSRNDDAVTISGSAMPHEMQEPDDENFSSPSHELVCIINRHNFKVNKTIIYEYNRGLK